MRADGLTPVALVGWGAIGRAAASMVADQPVALVAIGVRDGSIARPGLPEGAALITDPSQLVQHRPAMVAEAAGRASVEPWGRAALTAGIDLVVSSVSAFADPDLLADLTELARTSGARIEIQPGALAGVDALAGARHLGIDSVEHRMVKPPRAWLGTPAEQLCDLDSLAETHVFHQASAAEVAAAFPKNANVAMTTAMAGIGPERTTVSLVADPTATTNRHEITARGRFGELNVVINNNPLPDNPKSSALAAAGLVRAIVNRSNPISI